MKRFISLIVFLCCVVFAASPAFADICSDLKEGADAWKEIGKVVAKYGDDATEAEAKEMEKEVTPLAEATGELAGELAKSGQAELVAISKDIMSGFGALEKASNAKEAGAALKNIGKAVQKAADACKAE